MTVVDIPWSNDRVLVDRGDYSLIRTEVLQWIWDTFGNCHYDARDQTFSQQMRFTFLRDEHALLFKLAWGGK